MKKNIFFICFLLVLIDCACYCRAAEEEMQGKKHGMKYTLTDSSRKLPPSGTINNDPWIWNGEDINLTVLIGESEAFVLTIDAYLDMDGVRVEMPALKSEHGDESLTETEVLTEYYVRVRVPSGHLGRSGVWPDALIPHKNAFNLQQGKRKSFWISINIPEGTEPGVYKGELLVSGLLFEDSIPVKVTVQPLEIKRGTSLKTRICQDLHALKRFHPEWRHGEIDFNNGRINVSERIQKLLSKYDDLLADYRLSPGASFLFGNPEFGWHDGKPALNFAGTDWIYNRYLEEYDLSTFGLPFNYMNIFETEPGMRYGGPEFDYAVRTYLRALTGWFRDNGWLKDNLLYIHGSVFAGVEAISGEPHIIGKSAYLEVQRWAEIISSVSQELNFYVIAPPYYPEPLPDLRHAIKAVGWSMDSIDNDPLQQKMLNQRGIITMATTNIYSDAIDYPGFYHRALGFFVYRHKLSGFDQWQTFAWDTLGPGGEGMNPWSAKDFSGRMGAGGGAMIYPGFKGVEGPVSSIRLELMREAVEDYELAGLASSRGALYAEFAKQITQYVLPGRMRDIVPDPHRIYVARKALIQCALNDYRFRIFSGRVHAEEESEESKDGDSVHRNENFKGWIIGENSAAQIHADGSYRMILPENSTSEVYVLAEGFQNLKTDLASVKKIALQKKPFDKTVFLKAESNNEDKTEYLMKVTPGAGKQFTEIENRDFSGWDNLVLTFRNKGKWPVYVGLTVTDSEGRSVDMPEAFGFISAASISEVKWPINLMNRDRYQYDEATLGPIRRAPVNTEDISSVTVTFLFGGGELELLQGRLEVMQN